MATTMASEVETRPHPVTGRPETARQRKARLYAESHAIGTGHIAAMTGRSEHTVRKLRSRHDRAAAALKSADEGAVVLTAAEKRALKRELHRTLPPPIDRIGVSHTYHAGSIWKWARENVGWLDEWMEPVPLAPGPVPSGKPRRESQRRRRAVLASVPVSDEQRAELEPMLLAAYRNARRSGVRVGAARSRAIEAAVEHLRVDARVAERVLLDALAPARQEAALAS